MQITHTRFSLALLRRVVATQGTAGDELARASAALWVELRRAQAYRDALADGQPEGSSEPQTAKLRRIA